MNVTKKLKFVLEMVENIVRKREDTGFPRSLKSGLFGRVKTVVCKVFGFGEVLNLLSGKKLIPFNMDVSKIFCFVNYLANDALDLLNLKAR